MTATVTLVACPACDGDGVYRRNAHRTLDGVWDADEYPCSVCEGTGRLPADEVVACDSCGLRMWAEAGCRHGWICDDCGGCSECGLEAAEDAAADAWLEEHRIGGAA